jgi:linoleate 10R-lipoxygenase
LQDCQADTQDGSFGGILTRLLFRSLPDYYPPGSGLAHFPFLTPEKMKSSLKELGISPDKYIWQRPQTPQPPPVFKDYKAVQQILTRNGQFGPASRGFAVLSKGVRIDSVQIVSNELTQTCAFVDLNA